MILSRFLKPKWQHANPEIRKQALEELAATDPAKLRTLAHQDPAPEVRRAALERLNDLDLWRQAVAQDPDSTVRAAAAACYRALLAGTAANSPPLAIRLMRLAQEPDPELRTYLLQHAAEPELRLKLLEDVEAETALAEIATQNSDSSVQLTALERVQDPALLDQIARHSRNRDKRLYRRVRERLDALAAAQASAARCERLCAEMENLRWDGESGVNAGRFPKLDQEWRAQEADVPDEARARYAAARTRFLDERQASAVRRSARLELTNTLEALLERLRQAVEPDEALEVAIRHATTEIPTAWAALGPPDSSEGRRLDSRFQQLSQDLQNQVQILQRNHNRAAPLRALLQRAETVLQQPSAVQEADLKALRQQWEALERPEFSALTSELQQHFERLLEQLQNRLRRQIQQRDQEWLELQELAGQLETTASDGELQQATSLLEQIRQRLKQSIGLSRSQIANLEERLHACAGRLGELRDWRRWGAHQAREQLCGEVESLIDRADEPAEIARRIQQARKAWKELDHQEGGAAPKTLWRRFNTACERAYAPCQAYFAAQAEERRHNLDKKQALCAQLEQFVSATDWQQVDWRIATQLCREAYTQWRQIGPVDRAEHRALDRRFQRALRPLEQQLEAERQREWQRRQQLIEQVRALAEQPQLRTAVEAVKKAQAAWRPTVQGPPRQEQALWKEFRAACDAVFARRQAEQDAADQERQARLQHRQALCAEAETLSATAADAEQLAQARQRLRALQNAWAAAGPAPKSDQAALEQRFAAALRQFAQHEQNAQRASDHAAFIALHQRARLCAQLEALLPDPPTGEQLATVLETTRTAWEQLPPITAPLLEPLLERFGAAVQALTASEPVNPDGAPAEARTQLIRILESQLERKQTWCVHLEILMGVESPPEAAGLRMQHQVARLSASLTGGSRSNTAPDDLQRLQERWCLTGALPAPAEAALDARFVRALEVGWQTSASE